MAMINFLTLGVDSAVKKERKKERKKEKNNHFLTRGWVLLLCMNIIEVKVNIQVVLSTIQTYHLRLTGNEFYEDHSCCLHFYHYESPSGGTLTGMFPHTHTVFCDKHNIPFYL